MSCEPLLVVESVSKSFGGLRVVREASLAVESGCITAVIGPNGAGKTTLFALITGFQKPIGGSPLFTRAPILRAVPRIAWRGRAWCARFRSSSRFRARRVSGKHCSRRAFAHMQGAHGSACRGH